MHSPRVSWFKEWKTILGRNSKWRPFPRGTRGHFGALLQKCLRVISPHKNRACHVCSGCPSLFCLYSIFGPKTRHMPLHLFHSVFMGRFRLIFGTVWHQNPFFMGRFRLLLGQCGIQMHVYGAIQTIVGTVWHPNAFFMGRFRLLLRQCGIQMHFLLGDSDLLLEQCGIQMHFLWGDSDLLLGQCNIKMYFLWGDSDCCWDSVASKCIFSGEIQTVVGTVWHPNAFLWGDSDCCWDSVASKCVFSGEIQTVVGTVWHQNAF